MMSTDEVIQTMVERIVALMHPQQVILFGSQARGDAGPDSDVDLLVVMEDDVDRRRANIDIRVALADMPLPKDIIVTNPHEISTRGQLCSTVLYVALHDGKVLYAG